PQAAIPDFFAGLVGSEMCIRDRLNAKFNFQSIRHRSVIMFKAMFFFSAGAMFGYCYKHYDEKVIESNKSK
ncbi:hypothetical protein ACN6QZ_14730, partial [Acinetobacter baumannii]